jgi:hypothetical protein
MQVLRLCVLAAGLLLPPSLSSAAVLAPLTAILASDPRVAWVGRRELLPDGAVAFDYEGVSATVSVTGLGVLLANISDSCAGGPVGGGSRWLVTYTPADARAAPPNHRIQTFWTSPYATTYTLFSVPGKHCDPPCNLDGVLTLTRLTESRLSGCGPDGGLAVLGFATDGTFVAPPPPSVRRLEVLGDSISAGDLNDGGGAALCANGVFNDDITLSSAGQLCLPVSQGGFGADCMYTAWGGIRLGDVAQGWGMEALYPFTFSALGSNAYAAWNFSSWVPSAVIINLGTNDGGAATQPDWQAAYAAFVTKLVGVYYATPALPVFLAFGPMTAGYEAPVKSIVANLTAAGISAHALDLTLPHPMTGCFGHPSAADNVEIAAKAKPQIAAVLGW